MVQGTFDNLYIFCHFVFFCKPYLQRPIAKAHSMSLLKSSTTPMSHRTAIVTGASSGIGLSIAKHLAAAGAHVFLAGRTTEAMEHAKEQMVADGGQAQVFAADLRDPDQMHALVDLAVSMTGRLDIMVNNAGLEYPGSIVQGDPKHWRTMLETNVLSLLVGCQAAVNAMRTCSAEGHIVNISSVSAQRRNSGVYGATKHAVNVISASLRDELEEDTIRVTNVMPGATATNFARNFPQPFVDQIVKMSGIDMAKKTGEHFAPEALDALAANLKKNLCHPDDVARAVIYAVTQPTEVNIADIVVRPPRAMNVPH